MVRMFTWWRHQMETFSALLAICAGNSPVPVNSPHKGQWRGALMFSLICVWINGWVNNREAGDLRRYRTHYDVTVMNILAPVMERVILPVGPYSKCTTSSMVQMQSALQKINTSIRCFYIYIFSRFRCFAIKCVIYFKVFGRITRGFIVSTSILARFIEYSLSLSLFTTHYLCVYCAMGLSEASSWRICNANYIDIEFNIQLFLLDLGLCFMYLIFIQVRPHYKLPHITLSFATLQGIVLNFIRQGEVKVMYGWQVDMLVPVAKPTILPVGMCL